MHQISIYVESSDHLFLSWHLLVFLFGAYGVAVVLMEIGRILRTVFLFFAVFSFVLSVVTGKKTNTKLKDILMIVSSLILISFVISNQSQIPT